MLSKSCNKLITHEFNVNKMTRTRKIIKAVVAMVGCCCWVPWWYSLKCKFLLRWAKTSLAKLGRSTASSRNWRWFQKDRFWQGYPSRYKHVWTTLTGFWQDVAGKFRPHVLPSRITTFPSPSGEVSDHEAGCIFGQRGCHSQDGSDT